MKPDSMNLMTASQSWHACVYRPVQCPAVDIADRIRDRYRYWLAVEARPEQILRQNPSTGAHLRDDRSWHFAPELRLQLSFASIRPVAFQEIEPASRILPQVLSRSVRVETVGTSSAFDSRSQDSTGARMETLDLPAAKPIERVLVERPRSNDVQDARKSIKEEQSDLSGFRREDRSWPVHKPEPFQIPAHEVSRLTGEVIRTLDRRTIALRERMGRG